MNLEKLKKRQLYISLLDFILIILGAYIWHLIVEKNIIPMPNPDRLLMAGIGILTFVGLFYSLLVGSYFRDKKNLFQEQITRAEDKIKSLMDSKGKIAEQLNIYKEFKEKCESNLLDLDSLSQTIKLDYVIYPWVLLLIASIILSLLAYTSASLMLFFVGAIITFHILNVWTFIIQEEENGS